LLCLIIVECMPKNETPDSKELVEFDLKHRVTGAAILLFLGALVLPWMLGPPSEASKAEASTDEQNVSEIEPAKFVADSVLSDVIDDVEETVYISKITPLDAARADVKEVEEVETVIVGNQESDDPTSANESENSVLEALANAEQKKLDAQVSSARSVQDDISDEEKKSAELAKAKALEEKAEKARREQVKAEKERKARQAKEAQLAAVKTNKVDVGWVVQVGLFTEKSRALSLINELKAKGFSASSSVVDTNRGANTGTRVWLGPFAKRTSAIAEQKRLKSKAAKDGFIRVYP